mmetsp:Transcript_11487/g.43119  ORF Transcript_11487/g.43119 Transcript_11487/m.43119 type:complete len:158 (-) Transcript_11487:338-811(-)|eukprot:CAMPEP_0117449528 /NCGR_PEP_ID=MMETSP0759-20121206/7992_1 /TAXON_ID=63605 /ORGANISM="Percolomonas cosmopolitus, Strain WS" /LENGTH=157 /DNA_ID=CAMNT_0005242007 /DNA_START=546 /DNA_END=1019 /DNA_ORIENTATION=-
MSQLLPSKHLAKKTKPLQLRDPHHLSSFLSSINVLDTALKEHATFMERKKIQENNIAAAGGTMAIGYGSGGSKVLERVDEEKLIFNVQDIKDATEQADEQYPRIRQLRERVTRDGTVLSSQGEYSQHEKQETAPRIGMETQQANGKSSVAAPDKEIF